jgi:TolA-binding protein
MTNHLKIFLYVALIVSAGVLGYRFFSEWSRKGEIIIAVAENGENQSQGKSASPAAQEHDSRTNATETTETNQTVAAPATKPNATPSPPARESTGAGSVIGYFAAFVGVLAALGLLVAHDVSNYMGHRTVDFLFNDDAEGMKNPEYEEAEQVWANGRPLEAIQMMRDYLKKNPREQYVALRIAEIYEKDMKNYLAAALEYEEVLKHKLPAERWGWAAIHLCNIYSKLGKNDQCIALLRRIDAEYGETAAAGKARARLAMFDSRGDEALSGDFPDALVPPPAAKPVQKQEGPSSNLPPGFRPKKG